ncbi:hypothetical protein ACFSNO_27860 [Streptomyces cirratus]
MHPSLSRGRRFLCAGTYLDAGFRDRVIDELYVHEERIVAPPTASTPPGLLPTRCAPAAPNSGWAAGVLGAWFARLPPHRRRPHAAARPLPPV